MIAVREMQLFTGTGTQTNLMSFPQGAYITGAYIQNGRIYVSILWDDSRPYVNRKFHCTGPFNPINIQPGKRYWHVGTVGVKNTSTPGTPYHYYIIEEEV